MPDPVTIVPLAALKPTFDAIRSALDSSKRQKSYYPKNDKSAVIDAALATATSSSSIAEAEVSSALGYELRRAHFPPVIMLVVGYHIANHDVYTRTGKPVECPQCKGNTAGPYRFFHKDGPNLKPQRRLCFPPSRCSPAPFRSPRD